MRVTTWVVNTERAPTSPNHSQSTYVSRRRAPSSSASTITAAMMRRIRLRRDSFGRLTGGRVAAAVRAGADGGAAGRAAGAGRAARPGEPADAGGAGSTARG